MRKSYEAIFERLVAVWNEHSPLITVSIAIGIVDCRPYRLRVTKEFEFAAPIRIDNSIEITVEHIVNAVLFASRSTKVPVTETGQTPARFW